MSRFSLLTVLVALPAIAVGATPEPKEPPPTWPMFGGTPARNMVNTREKLPPLGGAGPDLEDKAAIAKWEAEWVLWKADLGTRAYGGPVVAGGRVYVGTNNERPRNKRDTNGGYPVDKGVLMVFDEKTGKFLWQAVHNMLLRGGVGNWPKEGITSTPTVIGDRVYYVSNRSTVVCADANGFADGNQGVQNERYQDPADADVIWEYDMIRELDVHAHCVATGCPLIVGDRLFVTTSNGVDDSHINIPSPDAPSLICLDRNTGKLLWKDNSPGKNILHGQWSSPAYAADPVPQVIHGQGDGWLRAFDPATGKLLWKFDGNRKGAQYELGGVGEKCDYLATPVVYGGRVYIGTGQDPEHSVGLAHLWCIDLKKAVELGAKATGRDVSPELLVRIEKQADGTEKAVTKPNPASAVAWVYGGEEKRTWARRNFKFGRTLSNVAVADDIVYAAELAGYVHCLNAKTGEFYWQYDMKETVWGSPYLVDGKVLVTAEAGVLFVFKHDPKPKVIDGVEAAQGAPDMKTARAIQKTAREKTAEEYLPAKIELPALIRTTPTVVNGVLYVATENTLYAIGRRGR